MRYLLLALILWGCSSAPVQPTNKLQFDDSNYRRELVFKVNGETINGYGTAKQHILGYTVEAKVSSEIFRGFIRSCNGVKKLNIEGRGPWKSGKKFKAFIPVLGEPFDNSCLVEIFLFSGDGQHMFGVFEPRGVGTLGFKSSCNYNYGDRVGSDFCHSSSQDLYFLDFGRKEIKFFFDGDMCPNPEFLKDGKWQIRVTPKPCLYMVGERATKQKARITILGWNQIFLREIF